MEDVPDSENTQSCHTINQEGASPESIATSAECSSDAAPHGAPRTAPQRPYKKSPSAETDASDKTSHHNGDSSDLWGASTLSRCNDDMEEDGAANRILSPAGSGESESKPNSTPASEPESDDVQRSAEPEHGEKVELSAKTRPETEVGTALTMATDSNLAKVTVVLDKHLESDESETALDDSVPVVKGMDIDDPSVTLLGSQEAQRSPTPRQTQIPVRTPAVEPSGGSEGADHELHDSTAGVKGLDLDVAITKSLDSIAVPVSNKQSDVVGVPIGRRHRRSAMQSRTLSVVSLLSKSGKESLRLNRNQKLTLFCLCLVNFTSYLSYSVIAPFYPQEASSDFAPFTSMLGFTLGWVIVDATSQRSQSNVI